MVVEELAAPEGVHDGVELVVHDVVGGDGRQIGRPLGENAPKNW